MKPTITRASATEIVISQQVDEIVSLDVLNQQIQDSTQALSDFETWVVAERAGRQGLIDDLQAKIDEAGKLGVVSSGIIAVL